jgi:proton-translocating NADH-quinone oxidoreductase, chain N
MDEAVKNVLDWNWGAMAPELVILGAATLMTILDLLLPAGRDRRPLAWLGLAGILIAAFLVWRNVQAEPTHILYDMYRVDDFANAFKLVFLAGAAFALLLAVADVGPGGEASSGEKAIRDRGEYFYLLLTGLLGAMMLASAADLIVLFVGLEVLALSSYILVALRRQYLPAVEGAFKYVVNGGIASAITLYGMSFLYGLTGSTNLLAVGEGLRDAYVSGNAYLVYVAFFFLVVGVAFKIAAAPFHMWAPDVYQGAPTPVTAFLAVVSKAAGFALLLRLLLTAFLGLANPLDGSPLLFSELNVYVGAVAAASMIIGNTVALRQTNVKRMMAYSSIAHAGYLLVPFASLTTMVFSQMMFYLVAYLFMTMGAFAVIQLVARDRGSEDLRAFAGLFRRSPLLALAMTLFLLSLAGLPLTAGFIGKFYLFLSAVGREMYALAAIMVLTSVVSFVYYFAVIRQMFLRTGEEGHPGVRVPPTVGTVIALSAAATVLLGLLPDPALDLLAHTFNFSEMFLPLAE